MTSMSLWRGRQPSVCLRRAEFGDYARHVAFAARGKIDIKPRAIGLAHGLDYVEHRIAVAVACIGDKAVAAIAQIVQRQPVGVHQIADMDKVPDAGAVGRVIACL